MQTDPVFSTIHDSTIHDADRGFDLDFGVYLPQEPSVAPVLFWSHGAKGSPTGGDVLLKHFTELGYIVIAPAHADSNWYSPAEQRNFDSGALEMADRVADMSFALDHAQEIIDQVSDGYTVDLSTPVIAGHSKGAFTTQLAVGTVSLSVEVEVGDVADPRFEAAMAFSYHGVNQGGRFDFDSGSFDAVTIPLLLVTGTEDGPRDNAEAYTNRLAAFDQSTAGGKHQWIIEGAEHKSFTGKLVDSGDTEEDINFAQVTFAADAFLGAYVEGSAAALADLVTPPQPETGVDGVIVSAKLNGLELVESEIMGTSTQDALYGGDDLIVFADGDGIDINTGFSMGAGTEDVFDLTDVSGTADLADTEDAASQVGQVAAISLADEHALPWTVDVFQYAYGDNYWSWQ